MPGTKTEQPLIRLLQTATLITIIAFLSLLAGCQPEPPAQQQFLQFGTLIDISIIERDDAKATRLFSDIEQLLRTRHVQWHGWMDGDLKRFNDALVNPPGNRVAIPASLEFLIRDSIHYHQLTSGLFNPALGKLVAAWGFHQSSTADPMMIKQVRTDIPGMHDLIVTNGRAQTLNPYLQLDFGAIAKGLAVRQIAQLLQQNKVNHFIINAGGDVYALGRKNNRPWRVAIEDPFQPGIIASLELESDLSIFTSGNYRRFVKDGENALRHHIINPRTGEPSKTISAVTVLHRDPVIADVAATTLMLTPLDQLGDMANKLGIEEFLVINETRDLVISKPLLQRINWHRKQDFNVRER